MWSDLSLVREGADRQEARHTVLQRFLPMGGMGCRSEGGDQAAGGPAVSNILWAWQCPICGLAVEDFADTDEQKCKWIFCPRCDKHVEMVKLPGGHVDATAAASWRKDAP